MHEQVFDTLDEPIRGEMPPNGAAENLCEHGTAYRAHLARQRMEFEEQREKMRDDFPFKTLGGFRRSVNRWEETRDGKKDGFREERYDLAKIRHALTDSGLTTGDEKRTMRAVKAVRDVWNIKKGGNRIESLSEIKPYSV